MKVRQILQKKKSRLLVNFEDGESLIASRSFVKKFAIEVGDDLDQDRFELLIEESKRLIRNRILKIVTRREIASLEILRRLTREGYNTSHIRMVIEQLTGAGVIDDDRFARSLIHDWTKVKPKGNRAIISELKRNGLNPDDYEDQLSKRNELEVARKFVRRKIGRGSQRNEKNRLVQMLLRRGFSSKVINKAVDESGDGLN